MDLLPIGQPPEGSYFYANRLQVQFGLVPFRVLKLKIAVRITSYSSSAFIGHIQQFEYSAKGGFRTRKRERERKREKEREGERRRERRIAFFLERYIICSWVRIREGPSLVKYVPSWALKTETAFLMLVPVPDSSREE